MAKYEVKLSRVYDLTPKVFDTLEITADDVDCSEPSLLKFWRNGIVADGEPDRVSVLIVPVDNVLYARHVE